MAFLNIDVTKEQARKVGEVRHIFRHCDRFHTIPEGSVLAEFVNHLHKTPFSDYR